MERQEFLKSLGISFAAVCAGACLSSCGKDEQPVIDDTTKPPPTEPPLPDGVLTAKFTDMPSIGKSIIVGKAMFVRIAESNVASSFIAFYKLCPHKGGVLTSRNNLIECNLHGARYKLNGSIKDQPRLGGGSTSELKLYPITVTATNVNANTKA